MTKKPPAPIGQQIATARKAAGWTQAELAEAIGNQQPNVAAIEGGTRLPNTETLERIAKALDASVVIDGRGVRLVRCS